MSASDLLTSDDVPVDEGSSRGEFFVVDRRAFSAACAVGLNPAVAYLTIARGAGSRSKSLWSIDAIERYTGISRPKAKRAVEIIVEKGLLTLERGGSRPLYGIVPAHELPGVDLLPEQPQNVWLPNAIIDGAADEIPPLALLRQMQDVRRLLLFVTLYDRNDLPNDGGVSRLFLHKKHELQKVGQRGASSIWLFGSDATTMSSLYQPFLTGQLDKDGKDVGLSDHSAALKALEDCGLIEYIPHVFESEKPEAEMMHAYPIKDGACEPWERSVAIAAHAAGIACMPPTGVALSQDWHLLPVPSHITNLAVIGIARLRYRPRTRMTAAWFAKSRERSAAYQAVYEAIVGNNGARGQIVA
jgi:hypothetical protein